jgi:hypothetical protein
VTGASQALQRTDTLVTLTGRQKCGDGDSVLPEAETCFFIIKIPKYRSKAIMRANLLSAITACREINF